MGEPKIGRGPLAALFLIIALPVCAQKLPFAHLSISDGLEDTVIFSMAQDHRGFLWISTRTGLNRFDGANFWTYTQAEGLPHNLVRDILQTRDGQLWVASERGVAWFDGKGFRALEDAAGWPERTSARELSEDDQGRIWVATYGAGVQVIEPGDPPRVVASYGREQGLPTERIRTLLADDQGNVWLGTSDNGVFRLSDGRLAPLPWRAPNDEVRALYRDPDGELLAGTRGGVARWDGEAFVAAVYDPDLADQTINAMTRDRQGRIWFGTREGGAFGVSEDGSVEHWLTEDGLPDNSVNEVFQDSEGNLWFGTYGGGVARLSTANVLNWTVQPEFPSPNVYAIADDGRGCIWFGTNGSGVTSLCEGRLDHYTREQGLPHDKVLSATVDGNGDPWFGTLEGISHLASDGFVNYGEADGLGGMVSYHLIPARDGGLWIGTIDGLSRYDGAGFSHLDENDGLPDNRVNRILERGDGSLWLATANGLALYEQGRFASWTTADGLPSNFINDLYEDDRGLWIATNAGLSRFADGRFENWNRARGLPHNNCSVILPGQPGEIWIGTSRGVAIFDGETFTVVTSREGLVFDLVNRGSGYRDPQGNLWFGTGGGVSRFSADFRPGPTTPPPVHLLTVNAGVDELPLDRPARIDQAVETLNLAYSAISFQRAPDVLYRYRLARGPQTPWRETRVRELQISSPAPGEYTFEVTARIGDGEWNPSPASFRFTVVPPFWRTPWFLVFIVATVVGALLYRNHLAQRRAEMLEATVRARTLELQKLNQGLEWLANHDNLTHLANRNQVGQRLADLYADDPKLTVGVIIIDLDHFKVINDRYGHAAGDRALEAFASLLHENVRTDQIASRWGGEEFLVVCPNIDADRLEAVAAHLLAQCRELRVEQDHGEAFEIRCSIGFASTPPGSDEPVWEKVMHLADAALLESKRAGRDRATGFRFPESSESIAMESLVADPQRAVDQGLVERRVLT